jgi:hypothetical protein
MIFLNLAAARSRAARERCPVPARPVPRPNRLNLISDAFELETVMI